MIKFVLIIIYLAINPLNANTVFTDLLKTQENINKIKDGVDEKDKDRVIGGREAFPGEVPHQIALLANGRFICGGSLIESNVVLTAAHCVYNSFNTEFTIRYNTLRYYSGPTIYVKKVLVHEYYNTNTNENDIAILVLSTNFVPDQNANTIGISQTFDLKGGSLVTVSGWGRYSPSSNAVSQSLKVANLTIVSHSQCKSMWYGGAKITNNMICAVDQTRSACNGDSGGPIVQNGKLVGVVSFGSVGCLNPRLPNVYTKVSSYYSWIKTTLLRYSGN